MLRTLNVREIFRSRSDASLAAGRLWGLARPVVRRTAADVGALVHEAISRIPVWNQFVQTGRARASGPWHVQRVGRLYRQGAVVAPPVLASLDYEQLELRAFAKALNFGMVGGISPAKFPPFQSFPQKRAWKTAFVHGIDLRPPLTMAKPNDWREAAIRRAAEAGAFEEVIKENKWRPPSDRDLQRAVAEKVSGLVGRTLHRKSWRHVAQFAWDAHRALDQGWNVGGIAIPRLRWDDAADQKAAAP